MAMWAAVSMSSLPLQGFDCAELLYSDYSQLPEDVEAKLGAKYSSLEDLVKCVLACLIFTASATLRPALMLLLQQHPHAGRDALCRGSERKLAVHIIIGMFGLL